MINRDSKMKMRPSMVPFVFKIIGSGTGQPGSSPCPITY